MRLTPKQRQILEFLHAYTTRNGYAPSQREIADHFGFKSLGTIQNYLVRLERQGAISKEWNGKRAAALATKTKRLLKPHLALETDATVTSISRNDRIRSKFVEPASAVLDFTPPQTIDQRRYIPLVGKVAAGRPIESVASGESIEVPSSLLKSGEYFVLQVQGLSMIEDGILDGDYVVVRKQSTAENGQTVVALVPQGTAYPGATIKRYYRGQQTGTIELRPANPDFQPMVFDAESGADIRIEGILAGVIRKTL